MTLLDRFQRQPPSVLIAESMLAVCFFGYIDYVTGYGVNIYLFYCIPILVVVWCLGRNAGLWISMFAALVWSIAETVSHDSTITGGRIWNICVQFVFFLFIVVAGAALKGQRDESRARVALLERFHTLAQISPVGIFRIGLGGALVYVNDRWRKIAGLADDEPLPQRWVDSFYADDRERVAAEWTRSGAERKACGFEARFQNAHGRTRWVLGQVAPEADGSGGIAGYVGAVTDMTELRRLEREVLEISEREQQRIGQDLHDDLCQQLVATQYSAAALKRELLAAEAPVVARSTELVELLKSAVVRARQMAHQIFPVHLDQAGLMSALQGLAESSSRQFEIKCEFVCPSPVLLEESSTGTHLFRIAQEALSNAVRHGHATAVIISLAVESHYLTLTVQDNGSGLPPKLDDTSGMGLHIMRYRAQMIGATLRVEPHGESGTLVRCSLHQPGSRLRSLVESAAPTPSSHAG